MATKLQCHRCLFLPRVVLPMMGFENELRWAQIHVFAHSCTSKPRRCTQILTHAHKHFHARILTHGGVFVPCIAASLQIFLCLYRQEPDLTVIQSSKNVLEKQQLGAPSCQYQEHFSWIESRTTISGSHFFYTILAHDHKINKCFVTSSCWVRILFSTFTTCGSLDGTAGIVLLPIHHILFVTHTSLIHFGVWTPDSVFASSIAGREVGSENRWKCYNLEAPGLLVPNKGSSDCW